MKKSAKKTKSTAAKRRSSKTETHEPQMPDLVAVMLKLTERLEVVERKMDVVVNQTSNRQSQPRPSFQNHQQPRTDQRPFQPQNFNRPPQSHNQHAPHQNQNRAQNSRPMFQTTCAECGKGCEVPFKPTGERPIFCQACFAKRKAAGQAQKPLSSSNGGPLEKKQLKVSSNGVGRTVISEMVAVSERQKSPARKNSKPSKKSKR